MAEAKCTALDVSSLFKQEFRIKEQCSNLIYDPPRMPLCMWDYASVCIYSYSGTEHPTLAIGRICRKWASFYCPTHPAYGMTVTASGWKQRLRYKQRRVFQSQSYPAGNWKQQDLNLHCTEFTHATNWLIQFPNTSKNGFTSGRRAESSSNLFTYLPKSPFWFNELTKLFLKHTQRVAKT